MVVPAAQRRVTPFLSSSCAAEKKDLRAGGAPGLSTGLSYSPQISSTSSALRRWHSGRDDPFFSRVSFTSFKERGPAIARSHCCVIAVPPQPFVAVVAAFSCAQSVGRDWPARAWLSSARRLLTRRLWFCPPSTTNHRA